MPIARKPHTFGLLISRGCKGGSNPSLAGSRLRELGRRSHSLYEVMTDESDGWRSKANPNGYEPCSSSSAGRRVVNNGPLRGFRALEQR